MEHAKETLFLKRLVNTVVYVLHIISRNIGTCGLRTIYKPW